MNKDKEKQQLVSEPITANPLASLLNKEKERIKEAQDKEAAAEAAKVRCKTCFREVAPKRVCSGHGGGGGGGGDSASSDKGSAHTPSQDDDLTKSSKDDEVEDELLGDFGAIEDSEALNAENFDSDLIADMIAKGLLMVDNDRESMTLTIKLLCEPNELTEEQREELEKFLQAIIKEFNEFKEENDLSDDCIEILQDENGKVISLRISMPSLTLYDAFIQRLANNLVPTPSPKAQERDTATQERSPSPNPFSMEPKPTKQEEEEEIEEEQVKFNPSPFNTKPW
ncbi:hypothetical protein BN59_02645 [Legionella massiliensis]|uniref:Uncharacterized protein n=1 Tax=Legionella massiliensis TaxID=1034943 RepID=A0A078KV72_9GAMM|nr:hypothetical protein [Legionella massiliensis]CDZ78335.1 hypothetical protein BN59_02645 [Legionella massiliensis]CEE14073.1 hypothetical protein BN1094_02645 [Legionella massiliensis]